MSQTVEEQSLVETAPPATRRRVNPWLSASISALVVLVAVAYFLSTAIEKDLPVTAALSALIGILVTQLLPGALVWRAVRPLRGWWIEDVVMGLGIGYMLAVGTQILAGWLQQPWLSGALPLGLAAVLLAVPQTRQRIWRARTSNLPLWWMPAVALTALFSLQTLEQFYAQVPLTWPSGSRAPHIDSMLHLALAAQLQHRGPTNFPWVEDAPLAYHFFSHAWVAQVATVSPRTGLEHVLFGVMPALMPLAIVLTVAVAAVRISGRAWAGPVAALLTIAGSELNLLGVPRPGYPMAPLSPSLAPSVVMLVLLAVLLFFRWRGELARFGLVLIPLAGIAAAGTKGSSLPLAVAGVGLAFVAMIIFDRSKLRSLLLDCIFCVGSLVVAMVVIFHGSDSGLHVQLKDAALATPSISRVGEITTLSLAYSSVSAVLGIMARGTGLLWRLRVPEGRRDPMTWLLLGGGFAGAAAIAVFVQPGGSQYYFARTAGPLLALGSAIGLVTMVDQLRGNPWRAIVPGVVLGPFFVLLPLWLVGEIEIHHGGMIHVAKILVVAALVLVAAGAIAWALMPQRRMTAFAAAVTCAILAGGVTTVVKLQLDTPSPEPLKAIKPTAPLAVSKGQIAAARFIRNHSDVNDVVMTNRHCVVPVEPVSCDTRRYVVGAYSERQMLVEAWTPTIDAFKLGPEGRDSLTVNYWKPDILALNDGFIAAPDAEKARKLEQLGVRWVFVDFTRPHAQTLEPFARERMRNGAAAVYELPRAGS